MKRLYHKIRETDMDYLQAKERHDRAKEQLDLHQETWDRDNERSMVSIMDKWQARCKHLEPDYEALAVARRAMIPLTPESEMDFEPLPDYGDRFTMDEFKDAVDCGGFIDSDGCGNFTYSGKMTSVPAYPSDVKAGMDLSRFDGVVWFNK